MCTVCSSIFVLGSVVAVYLRYKAVTMNLTRRQPLFKDARNFFRFRRAQLSNTYNIQFNRGEMICKRSMSEIRTQTVDASQEVVDSKFSVLAPVRTFYPCFYCFSECI